MANLQVSKLDWSGIFTGNFLNITSDSTQQGTSCFLFLETIKIIKLDCQGSYQLTTDGTTIGAIGLALVNKAATPPVEFLQVVDTSSQTISEYYAACISEKRSRVKSFTRLTPTAGSTTSVGASILFGTFNRVKEKSLSSVPGYTDNTESSKTTKS